MIEPVARLPDWEARLGQVIASSGEPVSYGRFDCAIWAARCVHAVWGIDFAADYIGRYGRIHAGLRLAGAKNLQTLVQDRMRPVAPFMALRGAIGLWRADKEHGLCTKDNIHWLAPMGGQIVPIEGSFITQAWTLD